MSKRLSLYKISAGQLISLSNNNDGQDSGDGLSLQRQKKQRLNLPSLRRGSEPARGLQEGGVGEITTGKPSQAEAVLAELQTLGNRHEHRACPQRGNKDQLRAMKPVLQDRCPVSLGTAHPGVTLLWILACFSRVEGPPVGLSTSPRPSLPSQLH